MFRQRQRRSGTGGETVWSGRGSTGGGGDRQELREHALREPHWWLRADGCQRQDGMRHGRKGGGWDSRSHRVRTGESLGQLTEFYRRRLLERHCYANTRVMLMPS